MGVDSDVVVEWDLDNDGDFDETEEDITGYVLSAETVTGRNWPSMLQGKATPGSLTARLDNSDDRFSYFNTSSPLATSPFSLQSGRIIRVRTSTSTIAEPLMVVRDRMDGVGAIGNTENGLAWTTTDGGGSPAGGWVRVIGGYLEATGETQYATVEAGTVDGYAQAQLGDLDVGNHVGLVYRWTDVSNHGRFVFNTSTRALTHDSITAGVVTTTNLSQTMEATPSQFLGIDIDGTTARVFVNGVFKATTTAHVGTDTEWGFYANHAGGNSQRPPTFEEYWMWDKMRAAQGGEIWWGRVTSVVPQVDNSGRKTATLKAEGPLADLAATTIKPPFTLGGIIAPGSTPGEMVGNCLGRAQQLHPPDSSMDHGSFTVGAVGYPDTTALAAARRFEEAEQGFLYETLEGAIQFDAKSSRGTGPTLANLSDHPLALLHYESFELLDWRREIINRVQAGVAVTLPRLQTVIGTTGDTATGVQNPVDITNPDFATYGAVAGDLVIHVIASAVIAAPTATYSGEAWLNPAGWTNLRSGLGADAPGLMRIYAKVLAPGDVGTTVRFYNDTGTKGGGWASQSYHFQNWRGAIGDGVAVEVNGLGDFPTGTQSRAGTHEPPTLFTPWNREPCLFLVSRSGAIASTGNPTITAVADNITVDGYGNMLSAYTNAVSGSTYDAAVQCCNKLDSSEVETPQPFGGSFTNFDHLDVATFAIRGLATDPVIVNDLDSQITHNSIRTHTNPANVFPDTTEADDYCDEIITRYADDAPIVRIGFTATKSTGYRDVAYLRRVGDLVQIEADNNSGMGINGSFVIESVRHRFSQGTTLWETTWELAE